MPTARHVFGPPTFGDHAACIDRVCTTVVVILSQRVRRRRGYQVHAMRNTISSQNSLTYDGNDGAVATKEEGETSTRQ